MTPRPFVSTFPRLLSTCVAFTLLASPPLSHAAPAAGDREHARRIYHAERLNKATPQIDGKLDDACWTTQGSWHTDYIQREPREGAPATHPTQIKILYDNQNLYVAIRAHQPGVGLQSPILGSRDEFTGDMVGIAIDSYHNRRTAFEFDVSSGGSKIDLVLKNDGSADTSWNAIWDVKTCVSKDDWCAEYRIPLSQLRYQQGTDLVWGLHSWRWITSLQEESNWNLLPMDNKGLVYSFGELHGINQLPKSRRLEIAPYLIAKSHNYASEAGNPYRTGRDNRVEGGLDAKYGLSSDITLDLTVNPDFSQVDADPSEINLGTVETFLRERRPFFLEGKDIFDFKLDDDYLFYTRRIGDAPSLWPRSEGFHDRPEATRILGSAKITGRTATGTSIGLLNATTDRELTRLYHDGTHRTELAEPLANSSILRLQQDLNGGDTIIGALFTANIRQGNAGELRTLPSRSYSAALDGEQYFNNRDYRLSLKLLGTRVEGSPEALTALQRNWVHDYQRSDARHLNVDTQATRLAGDGGELAAGRVAGLWRYNTFYKWRSPGVDFNDLGYLQNADWRMPGLFVQYYDTSTGSLLRRRDLKLRLYEIRDYDTLLLSRNIMLENEFATLSGTYLWTKFGAQLSRTDNRVLRGGPALRIADRFPLNFYIETSGGRPLQITSDGEFSTTSDGGLYSRLCPGLVWKPNGHLKTSLSIGYDRNRQPIDYAGTASTPSGDRYLMAHLDQHVLSTTLRVNVNISPTLSVSYYGGPFATTGRYSDFKVVSNPRASESGLRYTPIPLALDSGASLIGSFDGQALRLDNPDFNWREFKSNLVLRWEYRPGSSLYCVWSQYRSDWTEAGGFSPTDQYRRLFSTHPDNTLLVKASYWFSP